MRRKEYAVSLGLATPGRGRMSVEALDAIERARAKGMTFDDDNAAPKAPRAPREPAKPKPAMDGGAVFLMNETRYPIDSVWKGTDSKGKTHKMSARNACMNCGYSLCGHTCNLPVVLAPNLEHIAVTMIGG